MAKMTLDKRQAFLAQARQDSPEGRAEVESLSDLAKQTMFDRFHFDAPGG
jgi:hypothetical protein